MLRPLLVFLLLFLVFCTPKLFAQKKEGPQPSSPLADTTRLLNCATDIFLTNNRQNALFKKAEAEMNRAILRYGRMADTGIITLPVVFHIVDESPLFFSDADVQAAIKDLNDAFAKSGAYSASTGADTRIRFCLAKKDPEGGITTGITRTTSFFANDLNPVIEDSKLKALVDWDPARYINIWYIRSMHLEIMARFQCGTWSRMQAGGYATMPPGGGPTDGIVVTGLGSMLAHEMGHYLGLYHTFEGLNCLNFDCKTNGDMVCDTPPDASMGDSPACNLPDNSCYSDTLSGFSVDMPDDIANFMDYGNGSCHNKFTQGQADRMRAAIATQRSGLLVNKCDPPCTDAVLASFTRANAHPVVADLVSFANTSTGATKYEWLVNGTLVATTANFDTVFALAGKYKVTLKAYKAGACYSSFSQDVFVNCGVTARFYTDKREIASITPLYPDSIRFTNTSVGATSYQWLMSNDKGMAENVISTSKDLTYVFSVPGNYTVRLVASNGSCADTTFIFTIPVADATPDGALYLSSADCYQETKLRVSFFVCNNSYGSIPKGIPITFYDADPRLGSAKKIGSFKLPDQITGFCCSYLFTTILDVGYKGLNTVYGVFNDSGSKTPVVLPNTSFVEKTYVNNIWSLSGFAWKVFATPPLSVLEWGDTLQLRAQAGPGFVSSYVWSTAKGLNCTSCQSPYLVADSTTTKQVIATSGYGCTDTTRVIIQVPPYNDFSVVLDNVECALGDSLTVHFTLKNSFKRGVIPKGLTVALFNGDPTGTGGVFLPKLFSVPDTVHANTASFTSRIKSLGTGKIYAVVNDSGSKVPLSFPSTPFLEKAYGNNASVFSYTGFTVTVSPATATLEWGDTLQLLAQAGPGAMASYAWNPTVDLTCTTCNNPFFVADTSTTKTVVAKSLYGCTDTTSVTIAVPPYNDFSVEINDVQCKSGDSLLVQFTVRNGFKRPSIPKGLPVAFYKGDPQSVGAVLLPKSFVIADSIKAGSAVFSTVIKSAGIGKIYAVANDTGSVVPVSLPATLFAEKNYNNNFGSFDYAGFNVTINPGTATLEWGDTLQLTAQAALGIVSSYVWSSALNLTCTACQSPLHVADTTTTKQVIATSTLGCKDTATIEIQVPPYNDFSATIDEVQCARGDSLFVRFTMQNSFKRATLPKGLAIAFYKSDPRIGGATLLPPVFALLDTVFAKQASFQTFIKGMPAGALFAVINDSAKKLPVVFPATSLLEKAYENNTVPFAYAPEVLTVQPADTIVYRKSSFPLQLQSTIYNATSTRWSSTVDNPLSCTACASPLVAVYQNGEVKVETENKYGCLLKGTSIIKIFPPDMQVEILGTKCYTNDTSLVTFSICMNNGYDSVYQAIPVSFYDGAATPGSAKLLPPVFSTPQKFADSCAIYTTKILAPASGRVFAVVNDKGTNSSAIPDAVYAETDLTNNSADTTYQPFAVAILPADTAIDRLSGIQLNAEALGGSISRYLWKPAPYLSCATCATPFASPPYTTTFNLLVQNEYGCTATATAIVRTHSQEGVYIPNAFTPNNDGKNDVLYVIAGAEVQTIKAFHIFDRWGQRLFSVANVPPNTPLFGWRGTIGAREAPPAVYVYYVSVGLADGSEKTAKGTVMLIR